MALDLKAKASIRRHLGITAAGINTAGSTMGLRAVTRAGELELYMNNLQLEEEGIVMGRPYGAFGIYAPVVNGNQYVITVNGTAYTYTATAVDVNATDPLASVAQNIRLMLSGVLGNMLIACAALAVGPSPKFISTAQQISLLSLAGTFTLAVTGGTVIAEGADFPSPKYTVNDGNGDPTKAQVVYGLLPVCDALEEQVLNTSQNLSFSEVGSKSTGGASFRPDELRVRYNLLQKYRYDLGVFLGFYLSNSSHGGQSFGIRV